MHWLHDTVTFWLVDDEVVIFLSLFIEGRSLWFFQQDELDGVFIQIFGKLDLVFLTDVGLGEEFFYSIFLSHKDFLEKIEGLACEGSITIFC